MVISGGLDHYLKPFNDSLASVCKQRCVYLHFYLLLVIITVESSNGKNNNFIKHGFCGHKFDLMNHMMSCDDCT